MSNNFFCKTSNKGSLTQCPQSSNTHSVFYIYFFGKESETEAHFQKHSLTDPKFLAGDRIWTSL